MALLPEPGDVVVAAGVGITGLPVVRYLAGRGARVVATANRQPPPELAAIGGDVHFAGDLQQVPEGTTMVVTSAGIPPHHPLLTDAVNSGVEVIGEAELAWRIDHTGPSSPRDWLVVTGTNGKTTTIGMLEAILREDGRQVTACGNVGWPVLDAVLATHRQDLIVVELSSFQLYYAPSIRPRAGVVLNLAEDHLDWHGSMDAYAQAKAGALTGNIAVAVGSDPGALALLDDALAPQRIVVSLDEPMDGEIGVSDELDGEQVIDRAFGLGRIFSVSELALPGRHNLTNAMSAAALALAVGINPSSIAGALSTFAPGEHRNQRVAELDGVDFVNDSKATNPHAALASLLAYPRVVWIAGGQLKGADPDELVRAVADRLAGVVLLGVDAPVIEAALVRHAPDVPRIGVDLTDDGAMDGAVRAAASMAAPGTSVVLAPAAASLDMFTSYAARGDAFAAAVRALAAEQGGTR